MRRSRPPTSSPRSCSPAGHRPRRSHHGWCSPTPAPTLVGAVTSYTLLAREVGGLAGRRLVRFLVRIVIAVGISAAVAWGLRELLADLVPGTSTWHAVLDLVVVGVVFLAVYLGIARLLRISEVNDVMALVTRRLRGRR